MKLLVTRIGTMSHRPNFYDVSALQMTHRLRKLEENRSVMGRQLAICAVRPSSKGHGSILQRVIVNSKVGEVAEGLGERT